MNSLLQDLRYAVRTFASTRGLTATAILSLALAIGANTAISSVASALLMTFASIAVLLRSSQRRRSTFLRAVPRVSIRWWPCAPNKTAWSGGV